MHHELSTRTTAPSPLYRHDKLSAHATEHATTSIKSDQLPIHTLKKALSKLLDPGVDHDRVQVGPSAEERVLMVANRPKGDSRID